MFRLPVRQRSSLETEETNVSDQLKCQIARPSARDRKNPDLSGTVRNFPSPVKGRATWHFSLPNTTSIQSSAERLTHFTYPLVSLIARVLVRFVVLVMHNWSVGVVLSSLRRGRRSWLADPCSQLGSTRASFSPPPREEGGGLVQC